MCSYDGQIDLITFVCGTSDLKSVICCQYFNIVVQGGITQKLQIDRQQMAVFCGFFTRATLTKICWLSNRQFLLHFLCFINVIDLQMRGH